MSGLLLEGQSVHQFEPSTLASARAVRATSAAAGRASNHTTKLSVPPAWSWAFCLAGVVLLAAPTASLSAAESVRRLTFNASTDWSPDWCPDGSCVIFVSARSGGSNVWMMPAEGESTLAAVRLTNDPSSNWDPCFAPDGNDIAYVSNRNASDREIWRMNLASGVETRLTEILAYDLQPAWSPDGTRIVFASNRTGNWDIWVADDLPSDVEVTTWGRIKTRFWR